MIKIVNLIAIVYSIVIVQFRLTYLKSLCHFRKNKKKHK